MRGWVGGWGEGRGGEGGGGGAGERGREKWVGGEGVEGVDGWWWWWVQVQRGASGVAACPKATLNPATGQPVDKNLIYTVFREACYDEDPNDTWDHLSRLSKTHSPSDRGEISLNIKGWSLAGEGLDRANWRWSGVPCCDVGSAS